MGKKTLYGVKYYEADDDDKLGYDAIKDIIIIPRKIKQILTRQEFRAMLHHENFHKKNRHLMLRSFLAFSSLSLIPIPFLIHWLKKEEMECDWYSIKKGSKLSLLFNARKKVYGTKHGFVYSITHPTEEEVREYLLEKYNYKE